MKPLIRTGFAALSLSFILAFWVSSGLAQTEWEKYPGNPVLDLGLPGAWDDHYVTGPTILFNGTEYKMWYQGDDGSSSKIGHAASFDGIVWTKHPDNPVLEFGPGGSWDESQVFGCFVLYDDTEYKMWYCGDNGSAWRIGYATSSDGIAWIKYPDNPVLDLGPSGSWDDFHLIHPQVLFDGTEYKMWYTGDDGSRARIGYATSPDGTEWTKHPDNPVLDLGPSGSWEDFYVHSPFVILDESSYKMWYTGSDGPSWRLGYATSPDGTEWTKHPDNPVLDLGPSGSWDDYFIDTPYVLFDGIEYKMWYSGYDGSNRRIGYAISLPDTCDIDGDGSFDLACGGWDCDDSAPDVHSSAEEICHNRIDDDCDGHIDYDDPDCIDPGPIYLTVMYPGDTYSSSGTLQWSFDYDIWAFILVGDGLLRITVADGGVMGDTMVGFLYHSVFGLRDWGWATSPDSFTVQSASSVVSLQFLLTTYYLCPSGYPAGYHIEASFTHNTTEDMVSIPAGEFVMGSDNTDPDSFSDEYPEHVVNLSGYEIDVYEVTNGEFAEFLNAYGSNESPEGYEMLDAYDPDQHIYWDGSSWYVEGGYADHPVVEVTWYGANTYCDYNGKRLPTEAEWEKAARGGCEVGGAPGACEDPADERTYPWGEGIDCDHANYYGCEGGTTPVGSYPLGVSPYGPYDMAGNVWEWVKDWYDGDYYDYSPYQDPQGPVSGMCRVLRGGAWYFGASGLRVALHLDGYPDVSSSVLGFRCAR